MADRSGGSRRCCTCNPNTHLGAAGRPTWAVNAESDRGGRPDRGRLGRGDLRGPLSRDLLHSSGGDSLRAVWGHDAIASLRHSSVTTASGRCSCCCGGTHLAAPATRRVGRLAGIPGPGSDRSGHGAGRRYDRRAALTHGLWSRRSRCWSRLDERLLNERPDFLGQPLQGLAVVWRRHLDQRRPEAGVAILEKSLGNGLGRTEEGP